jgi:hypothetical protein
MTLGIVTSDETTEHEKGRARPMRVGFANDLRHPEDMMANDRDDRGEPDTNEEDVQGKKSDAQHKRVIGKGMTSPDSTQVPLKAETGEPDWDAIKGRVPKDSGEDRSS